jgi:UDP-glucose 4-epimerase
MTVLVTGSAGTLGVPVSAEFRRHGYSVREFDLADGDDVRDAEAVRGAVAGVRAVVHLAGFTNDDADPSDIMATNVGGTWNVVHAAADSGVERVVFASSVNALGVFRGERTPDYLPIDDDHPVYASSAYGISKYLAEEVCAMVSRSTRLDTLCLRIPHVLAPGSYPAAAPPRRWPRRQHRDGWWEYGAFIDVRDVASAFRFAVDSAFEGHARVLIAGPDAAGQRAPVAIADERLPEVAWRDRARYEADPRLALVDTSTARQLLGWTPQHSWAENAPRTRVRAPGRSTRANRWRGGAG